MQLKKPYVDINDTLRHMKIQIMDGVPYADATTPEIKTPRELWDFLKPKLKYKNDPKNVELLQSYETLMRNNYWGTPGAGDCDCFTIATQTVAIVCGFQNTNILLCGRSRQAPVHIYSVIYFAGRRCVLDFTQPSFDSERYYPLTQEIPVKWQKWPLIKNH